MSSYRLIWASAQGWIRRVWVGRSWMELHHGNLTPAVRFSAMGTLGMGDVFELVCLKRRCTVRTPIKLQLLNEKRDDLPSKLESTLFFRQNRIIDIWFGYIYIIIYICIKLIPIAQRFISSQYVGRVYLYIWYKLQTLYIYGYLYIYNYIGSLKWKCFVNLITIPGMNIQVIQVPCPRSDIYN
jgi:hypothetical protein